MNNPDLDRGLLKIRKNIFVFLFLIIIPVIIFFMFILKNLIDKGDFVYIFDDYIIYKKEMFTGHPYAIDEVLKNENGTLGRFIPQTVNDTSVGSHKHYIKNYYE